MRCARTRCLENRLNFRCATPEQKSIPRPRNAAKDAQTKDDCHSNEIKTFTRLEWHNTAPLVALCPPQCKSQNRLTLHPAPVKCHFLRGCASRFWVAIRRRSNLPRVGANSIRPIVSPKNLTHTRDSTGNCHILTESERDFHGNGYNRRAYSRAYNRRARGKKRKGFWV